MTSPSPAAWFRRALPTRRRAIAAAAVVVLLAAAVTWAVWPQGPGVRTESAMLTVRSGPSGDQPVDLDTTLYLPDDASAGRKVPAVLLAHGFGGTKESVRSDAEEFAGRGYAVLTWTARGFGRSGGRSTWTTRTTRCATPQRLLDWLAARPEVRTDAAGDPKVGVVGGSYGGGLALLLAAQDQRVDAIVPMITWNDLSRAFLPESTGGSADRGRVQEGLGRPLLRRRRQRGLRPGRALRRHRRPAAGRTRVGRPAQPAARAPARAPVPVAPRPVPPTRPAAGSPPTSAPRTCGSPPPAGPTRPPWTCCAGPARPACWTGSRRRPCWCRARRTPSSRSARRTPTRAASPPPAPRCGSPGSPAGTTAAAGPAPTPTG